MRDSVFRARMVRADRRFQRALAEALAPAPAAKKRAPRARPAPPPVPVLSQEERKLAAAKIELKSGWGLDAVAARAGLDRAELDLKLWDTLGRRA